MLELKRGAAPEFRYDRLAVPVLKKKKVISRRGACLHAGRGRQVAEVTRGGSPHLSCKRDQIKMRDYMDRRVTHQSGLPHPPGVPHLYVNRHVVVQGRQRNVQKSVMHVPSCCFSH